MLQMAVGIDVTYLPVVYHTIAPTFTLGQYAAAALINGGSEARHTAHLTGLQYTLTV